MESRGSWSGREGDGGGGYRVGGRLKGRKMEGKMEGGRPVELVVTAQTLQSTLSQFYACVYCIIVSNQ